MALHVIIQTVPILGIKSYLMCQMPGLMKAAGDKVQSFAYRRKSLGQEAFTPYKYSKPSLNTTTIYTSTIEVNSMTVKLWNQGIPSFLPCWAVLMGLPAPQDMAGGAG